MKNSKINFFILFSILVFTALMNVSQIQGITPNAYLILKTTDNRNWSEYADYIQEFLDEININVTIKIETDATWYESLLTGDFDLAIVDYYNFATDPDMRSIFTESAFFNWMGLSKTMPYGNESENLLHYGITITDPEERKEIYDDWQKIQMDKILGFFPILIEKKYAVVWDNIVNYDIRRDLVNNLPYMYYNGLHEGQSSFDALNIHKKQWFNLNPLYQRKAFDFPDMEVTSLIMDPIAQGNINNFWIKTGLIYDWEKIDEAHYKFYLRDNIFWNPSYNVLSRTSLSPPLGSIPPGELMRGLRSYAYSDGSNQQVLAKDVVFTYLALANPLTSPYYNDYSWIRNIYVDPFDDLAYHLHTGNEYGLVDYAPMFTDMSLFTLPEFFLNSSDTSVSYSSGGVKTIGFYDGINETTQWINFEKSAFGCGQYMLDYYDLDSITVLQRSPYWHGIGPIDGSTGKQPFVDTINIHVFDDLGNAFTSFKSGNLDIFNFNNIDGEYSNLIPAIKEMASNTKYNLYSDYLGFADVLLINLKRPFVGGADNYIYLDEPGKEEYTKGLAVRKAICYSIDREIMNREIHSENLEVFHSPILPILDYWYYDYIIKYDKDIHSANEWLLAADYDIKTKSANFLFSIFIIGIIVTSQKMKRRIKNL